MLLKALVINSYVLFGCSWGIRVNGKMRVFNKLVITIVACFIKDIETWFKNDKTGPVCYR